MSIFNNRKPGYKAVAAISVILFIISLLIRALYDKTLQNYLLYPDTQEYFEAAALLAEGRIHTLRLPVYSAYLLAVSLISGRAIGTDSFVVAVSAFQRIISSTGVVFLFHALLALWTGQGNNEATSFRNREKAGYIIAVAAAAFYAVSPAVINWDFLVLTESLTMFLIIVLIWSYFNYLRHDKMVYLVISFVLSGILMFIKPFYLFFPVLMFINVILSAIVSECERKKKIIVYFTIF
jgi:hypothetical protein